MKANPGRPIVIGHDPSRVQPALGGWTTITNNTIQPGHIVALRLEEKLRPDVLAQLGSLGEIDQLVLVVSLSSPLHISEREFAKQLASYATTIKVVVVAVPGHEPTVDDLAEVNAVAVAAMNQAGFDSGRCLATGIWFASGSPLAGSIANIGEFILNVGQITDSYRDSLGRSAAVGLFSDMKQLVEKAPTEKIVPVSVEDQDRLTKELSSYLADLGRTLTRQLAAKPDTTTAESLRRNTLDNLHGWSAYLGVEGHWMKYVDRLRSGAQIKLQAEAEKAISELSIDPGRAASQETPLPPGADRVMLETKRVALGLGLGLVCFFSIGQVLKQAPVPLPDLANTIISIVVLVVLSVLGYSLGSRFFRAGPRIQPIEREHGRPASLIGWQHVQQRLTTWFREFISAQPPLPADELRNLAQRLGITEKL